MSSDEVYWARTKRLMITCLVIWAIFGFGVHLFATQLNQIVILGFPLGFYMAAQGSLIVVRRADLLVRPPAGRDRSRIRRR